MTAPAAPEVAGRTEFALWGGVAVVAVSEPSELQTALTQVRDTVELFDRSCSNFRTDSELALLNASPEQQVVVSSLLFTAIREALRASRLTDGAVDPTVGGALVAQRINPNLSGRAFKLAPAPGSALVKLDDAAQSVTLRGGAALDLGASAKALAADIAAAAAAEAAGCGVLVSLLGDVAVAGPAPQGGWKIRVTDDHRDAGAPGQTVAIHDGGLASSSVTVRRSADGDLHHLIDPSSGRPAAGPWRTASVCAQSCLDANTASTAAIVLGAAAPEWLDRQRIPARLVSHEGDVVRIAGWPSEGDDL